MVSDMLLAGIDTVGIKQINCHMAFSNLYFFEFFTEFLYHELYTISPRQKPYPTGPSL